MSAWVGLLILVYYGLAWVLTKGKDHDPFRLELSAGVLLPLALLAFALLVWCFI